MPISRDRVLAIVKAFSARTKGAKSAKITSDTQLLAEGYLDSFALVELIAELEKELDVRLEEGSLIPEDFETTNALCERLEQVAGES